MDSYDPLYVMQKPGSFQKRTPIYLGKRPSQTDHVRGKRRNVYREDASSDSKNIDTLYRILCPMKSVGSVLGKGGSIISALRDETHAKIRIADSIPGANDRVIIIFSHVSSESRRYEDEHMQPHCAAQDALLKIHDRIAADEYAQAADNHNETDSVVTARLLVPNNQVGCLIGKGGDVIQKLRLSTGANIRIASAENLPACAMKTDELVQISGVVNVVKNALYDISTLLHQHPRKEIPPLDDIISASTQGLHSSNDYRDQALHHINETWFHENPVLPVLTQDRDILFRGYNHESPRFYSKPYDHGQTHTSDEFEVEFLMKVVCPAAKIGGVIGKGGINVRQLEQRTGARIHVEDHTSKSNVRIIHISSKESALDSFSPTIEAVLQLQEKTSEVSDSGKITTTLLVPSSKAGCLLGQGGHIINEMRRRTKADICIFLKKDKPDYVPATEEIVQISGNNFVTQNALTEIASRLRERTLRDGNADRDFRSADRISHQESVRHLPESDIANSPTFGGYEYLHMKDRQLDYESEEYQFRSAASRYPSFHSPVEYKTAVPSDMTVDRHRTNNSGIRQPRGERVDMYDAQLDAYHARQDNVLQSRYDPYLAQGRYETRLSRPY